MTTGSRPTATAELHHTELDLALVGFGTVTNGFQESYRPRATNSVVRLVDGQVDNITKGMSESTLLHSKSTYQEQ